MTGFALPDSVLDRLADASGRGEVAWKQSALIGHIWTTRRAEISLATTWDSAE